MSPNTLATINKILLKFGHFVILNFEFAEYSRKNRENNYQKSIKI